MSWTALRVFIIELPHVDFLRLTISYCDATLNSPVDLAVKDVNRKSSVRLYAILAREAPVAVVFRRGPSKEVLLSLWRTDSDEFAEGQWFKGRIYERRCDLSPSGKLLIYLAAKYKEPHAWTAISKPPYLTALAMWMKQHTWGRGGLFAREDEILLNHSPDEMNLAEGFRLPRYVKVKPCGEYSGRGENSPIMDTRMSRDGWRLIQDGKWIEHKIGSPVWIEFEEPQIWQKPNPKREDYELVYKLAGIHERDGPAHLIDHLIVGKESDLELGRTDWADWCHSGDLLFAKEGKIFRLGFDHNELRSLDQATLLRDFNECRFEAKESPAEAKVWDE